MIEFDVGAYKSRSRLRARYEIYEKSKNAKLRSNKTLSNRANSVIDKVQHIPGVKVMADFFAVKSNRIMTFGTFYQLVL